MELPYDIVILSKRYILKRHETHVHTKPCTHTLRNIIQIPKVETTQIFIK